MTSSVSPLAAAAHGLTLALEQETRLARAGALDALVEAAAAKQMAFATFRQVCENKSAPDAGQTHQEKAAIKALLTSANENAVVLEAVKTTLDEASGKLRTLLSSIADPGTYGPVGRVARHHIPAARIDAQA